MEATLLTIQRVFPSVLRMSISASWLVFAVLVLRFVLRCTSKWSRCLLWARILARMCPAVGLSATIAPTVQDARRICDADKDTEKISKLKPHIAVAVSLYHISAEKIALHFWMPVLYSFNKNIRLWRTCGNGYQKGVAILLDWHCSCYWWYVSLGYTGRLIQWYAIWRCCRSWYRNVSMCRCNNLHRNYCFSH